MDLTLPPLAHRVEKIEPFYAMEVAKQAQVLASQGRDIIAMNIGEPDFSAAPPVLAAMQTALESGRTHYSPALGIDALREAISRWYRESAGLAVAPERIAITAGASAALLLACAALVSPGDEILMPDPCYPCNRHFVSTMGGIPRLIPSTPRQRFQLDLATVKAHWGNQTRGVLLASPSNPTGACIPESTLEDMVDWVRAQGGVVISDEIYQGLVYTGPVKSALHLGDDIVSVNSFSKYFNMTGWRLGWLVLPPAWVPAIEKLAQNLFICPSTPAQYAALACFSEESIAIYEQRKRVFSARRELTLEILQKIGFEIPVEPDGAFYVYANASQLMQRLQARHPSISDSSTLALSLLSETGVVVTPGKDFSVADPDPWVRFSYATGEARLREAGKRMQAFFDR